MGRVCRWCGRNFDSGKAFQGGVGMGASQYYCSVRCKNLAEKNKPKPKKLSKSEMKFVLVIIAIVFIYLLISNKCSEDKKETTTQVATTTTPVKETKSNQTKIEQEPILESVNFEKVSIEEKQTLESLVQEWSTAHNDSSQVNNFGSLFDDFVQFYGTRLSKENCIEKKEMLLQTYSDFLQEINSSIEVKQIADNEYRCDFVKTVTVNQKTTDYPSYLVFKKAGNKWRITTESDLITDKNLAKKK